MLSQSKWQEVTSFQPRTAFEKIVYLGMVDIGQKNAASLFCKIKYENGKLSISGVEGPNNAGNCRGSCGQIDMHEWKFNSYASGWNSAKVKKFRDVWAKWHLNDMVAGSPNQQAWLEANSCPDNKRLYHYTWATESLAAAGLNPDPNYIHNGKPYVYGAAWLTKELPEDAINFLYSLPNASKRPAWV